MEETKINIENGYPPNWEKIQEVFPAVKGRKDVFFAYGGKIYKGENEGVPEYLLVHEKIHLDRQVKMGNEEWWGKYLTDPTFRLQEEILAYSAQYKFMKERLNAKTADFVLDRIAEELSSELYGNMVEYHKGHSLIRHKAKEL